jgi:transitional endoplasmic reticulum ATPase
LKEAVEWPLTNPEMFKKMGIRPPRGILLYGPPGTGKTLLAKAIANESNANFLSIKGPEVFSKWVGESEKALRNLFKKAKQSSPSIIFLDEIDALAPKRGMYEGTRVTDTVVNQLLTSMDGVESMDDVVVIGATNRPDIIDPSFLRPGRFDELILVGQPDKKAREEIYKIHMKGMPIGKDVDVSELADMSEGYAGADIEAICREAAMTALRENSEAKEVKREHFMKAFETVRPSIDDEMIEYYKEIASKLGKAIKKEIVKGMEVM